MREALLLSLVAACVSFTISETKLFAGLRAAAHRLNPWTGELISCGYCLSYWVTATLTGLFRPQLFPEQGPAGYVLTWLVITWMAAWQWAAMCWLLDKAGK
jgi:hypothetical protein